MRRRGLLLLSIVMACTQGTGGAEPSKAKTDDASAKAKADQSEAKKATADAKETKGATPDEKKAEDPKPTEPKPDDAEAEDAKPDEAKPEEPKADSEISPRRAIVLADGKLLSLAPSGKTELIAEVPGATECDQDPYHHVVWLVAEESISAYDPADGALHRVVDGIEVPDDGYGGISWQAQRDGHTKEYGLMTAGNVEGLDECVALVIAVSDENPRVGGTIIAEGDREWYCFEDDEDVGEDRSKQRLNADESAIKARYDKAKLLDPKYLETLAARFAKDGMHTWPDLETPPAPKPKVDRTQCEENPDDCGTGEYLGGGRLWRLVTYNSRGDFYHESHHIYDTKTKSWWDPAKETHSKTPTEDAESAITPSPDGTWGLHANKILSLSEAKSTTTFKGDLCGWQ
ncbi:MAG: hypothetical protein AAF799_37090 [Myxococcota bacterium]